MSDALAQLQELIDKEGIRAATIRYCRGADRLDAELISSAFHPDARDDHGGSILTGEEAGPAVVKMLTSTEPQTEDSLFFGARSTLHYIMTQTIDVDGDNASCESYFTTIHFGTRNGVRLKLQTYGRWIDRLEKRNDEWRISDRQNVMEVVDEKPLPDGKWMEVTALAHGGNARRDKSDPSYEIFDSPTIKV